MLIDRLLRVAPSSPSNIRILLRLYLSASSNQLTHSTLTSLLTRLLSSTLLFSHDPSELELWLLSLPSCDTVRGENSEAPDDTRLKDEKEPVVEFLEACLLRCGKTPHRYLEELDDLLASSTSPLLTDPLPAIASRPYSISPLMATCLEQLSARVKGSLFDPSDLLAITTFLRKLIVNLLGQQSDPNPCVALAQILTDIVTKEGVMQSHPAIEFALKTECKILRTSLWRSPSKMDAAAETFSMEVDGNASSSEDETIRSFLSQIERSICGMICPNSILFML